MNGMKDALDRTYIIGVIGVIPFMPKTLRLMIGRLPGIYSQPQHTHYTILIRLEECGGGIHHQTLTYL